MENVFSLFLDFQDNRGKSDLNTFVCIEHLCSFWMQNYVIILKNIM